MKRHREVSSRGFRAAQGLLGGGASGLRGEGPRPQETATPRDLTGVSRAVFLAGSRLGPVRRAKTAPAPEGRAPAATAPARGERLCSSEWSQTFLPPRRRILRETQQMEGPWLQSLPNQSLRGQWRKQDGSPTSVDPRMKAPTASNAGRQRRKPPRMPSLHEEIRRDQETAKK